MHTSAPLQTQHFNTKIICFSNQQISLNLSNNLRKAIPHWGSRAKFGKISQGVSLFQKFRTTYRLHEITWDYFVRIPLCQFVIFCACSPSDAQSNLPLSIATQQPREGLGRTRAFKCATVFEMSTFIGWHLSPTLRGPRLIRSGSTLLLFPAR